MATTDQRSRQKSRQQGARRRTIAESPDTAGSPDSAESLTEAIALLESFVSTFEPGRYGGEDAARLVEHFSRGEHLCATGKALAAKRATETELHKRDGVRSAAEWLARKTGDTLGGAAGSLQLADQMGDHLELGEALRKGQLSHARARQVADVLRVDPTSEDELVEAAKDPKETNRQLQDRCLRAKAKARSGEDTVAHYERIRKSRYLRHYTDGDGALRLEGLFTPDAGAKVIAALKPTRTAIFDEARAHGVRERPEAYEADALVALLTGERPRMPRSEGYGQADTGRASTGRTSTPVNGTRKATRAKGSNPTGSEPTSSGQPDPDQTDSDPTTTECRSAGFPPPASVHLRVDLAALRRGHLDDGECCEIPGVGPVPLATARSVLGDAIVHLVITKGSDIATVSNLGRTIRAPLRTALIERDQTCVIPGCDVREGLEIDHRVIPVVENGETALWNLARLCKHHHYLRHHKGFRLEGGPGAWEWLPPEKPPPRNHEGDEGSDEDDRLFRLP
jgi:hypothetical protein